MVTLPASIEKYLIEAEFTATEMLVLKRLLEGESMTLRELASKTGKSTGVLDQATRKLIERKLIRKEQVNDASKYVMISLDAMSLWMEKDMKLRHAVLDRKRQDFEAFIATVQHETTRPDMDYYEGLPGIKQALTKLLDMNKEEWLCFEPATRKEEEDPLLEFRVDLFRQRRKRKTFMRVISPDVPLGRRYQCRNYYEYRDSRLVNPEDFPVSFEQYIVGDIVACIDIEKEKASFIRYPEFAASQCKIFEMLWCKAGTDCSEEECEKCAAAAVPSKPDLETKVLSSVRDFFISRSSMAKFGVMGLIAAVITGGLYMYNQSLNFQRMQDRVVAIARTAAVEIEVRDLDQLHRESDYKKPAWRKVVSQLKSIKDINGEIVYVYIFRKAKNSPTEMEFVADASSMNPYANTDADPLNDVDANGDGVIEPDEADYLQWPGQPYPDPPEAAYKSFRGLSVSDFYEDQWGKVVSGYAPITDAAGTVVAVLAVDMKAVALDELTSETFKPLYMFLALFFLFVVGRLVLFHQSLCKEMMRLAKIRHVLLTCCVCAIAAATVTFWLYSNVSSLNTERVRDQVRAIAATAAQEFDVDDIHAIQTEADIRKPEWEILVEQLRSVRERNADIRYVYLLRPTDDPDIFEFVSDADSIDPYAKIDLNNHGVIDDSDALNPPGDPYDVSEIPGVRLGMIEPSVDEEPFTDQWGTFISGFAPIKDSTGKTVAVLGVDRIADDVKELTYGTFKPLKYFMSIFLFFVLFRLVVFHQGLFQELVQLSRSKKVLVPLAGCAFVALLITAGMYKYTLELKKEELGQRLMSIASTAAPQITSRDLKNLHFANDMKRLEYRRLHEQLNDIRNRNENIKYVYIMRPKDENSSIWEFVVDADTTVDSSGDSDSSSTGLHYDLLPFSPEMNTYGLQKPTYENDFVYDQWGIHISGSAPITDDNDIAIAALAMDIEATDVYESVNSKFKPYIWFFAILGTLILIQLVIVLNKK